MDVRNNRPAFTSELFLAGRIREAVEDEEPWTSRGDIVGLQTDPGSLDNGELVQLFQLVRVHERGEFDEGARWKFFSDFFEQ